MIYSNIHVIISDEVLEKREKADGKIKNKKGRGKREDVSEGCPLFD